MFVSTLQDKQEALSEQISRIIRRRDGEIGGARRQTVSKLRSEREQWVNLERSKLAKLADSKTDAMKTAAVEELEPVLTELIRKQVTTCSCLLPASLTCLLIAVGDEGHRSEVEGRVRH